MVFLLVGNVLIHAFNLRMSIGKSTISLLPAKFGLNELLFIDISLDIDLVWFESVTDILHTLVVVSGPEEGNSSIGSHFT